jgi:hypothetical protein
MTLDGFAKPYDLRVIVRIFPLLPSTRPFGEAGGHVAEDAFDVLRDGSRGLCKRLQARAGRPINPFAKVSTRTFTWRPSRIAANVS